MTTYDLANDRITDELENNKIDNTTENTNANNYAKNIMISYEEQEKDMNRPQQQRPDRPPQQAQQYQQAQQAQQARQRPEPPMQPMHDQYQPPIPTQTQQPFPQQSQYMNVNQTASSSSKNGDYTGIDTGDNLSPLDTAFNNTIKAHHTERQSPPKVNSAPQMNDSVSPYSASNVDNFSLF